MRGICFFDAEGKGITRLIYLAKFERATVRLTMLLNAAKKIPRSCSERKKSLHFTLAVVQHSLVRNRARIAGQPQYKSKVLSVAVGVLAVNSSANHRVICGD